MAYLIIDGYNLIGTAHDDLQTARNDLILTLSSYSRLTTHEIILVFDGWKGGSPVQTKTRTANITVIYSKLGETADTVIRRMIRDVAREWIVVSSDREISACADRKDQVTITADEFEEVLSRSLTAGGRNEADTHFRKSAREDPLPKKGNPRKLSRKELKKLRVLKKL